MSDPLKKEYFCIADSDYLNVVDKLRGNDLSEEDKKLIEHIMLNHRHIIKGRADSSLKNSESF